MEKEAWEKQCTEAGMQSLLAEADEYNQEIRRRRNRQRKESSPVGNKDDFRRIRYTRFVGGRVVKTSISISPDLFSLFLILCNDDEGLAVARLTNWAQMTVEDRAIEMQRSGAAIGASRLVHRRVLDEVRAELQRAMRRGKR